MHYKTKEPCSKKKKENFVIKKTNTPKILNAQVTPLLKVKSETLPLICFITVVSIKSGK